MDERILAFLETLNEIQRELGPAVYESALERARIAVAAEVMVEAERRALDCRRKSPSHSADGNLITINWGRKRNVSPEL